MAGTIQHRVEMSLLNGSNVEKFQPGSKTIVQNGIGGSAVIINVSTSTGANSFTTLPITGVGTVGVAYFQNLDLTNSVEVGPSTTTGTDPYLFNKYKAGEPFSVRLSTNLAAMRAVATGGPVELKVWILED